MPDGFIVFPSIAKVMNKMKYMLISWVGQIHSQATVRFPVRNHFANVACLL